ncbi:MAG: DUF6049 family protein [Terrimesophilobacter sp.]
MKIIPLLIAFGLAVGGFVVPAGSPAPDSGDVTIVAAPDSAGVLRPGQTLVVSGTVTNDTGQQVNAGIASIHIATTPMITRPALANWLSTDVDDVDPPVGRQFGETQIGALAAGQTKTFVMSVPATNLTFLTADAAVFQLEIRLSVDQVTLGLQRSTISWLPTGSQPRVRLALVAPLIAPPAPTGLLTAESLSVLTSPGGILYEQLVTLNNRQVTIGFDPMIVASIKLLGDSAPPSALNWLQQLKESTNDRFALSFADADQLLLHRAGAAVPLEPLSFPEQQEATPEPVDTNSLSESESSPAVGSLPASESPLAISTNIDGLAWPVGRALSNNDLDFFTTGGFTRTLLSASSVTGSSLLTPNASVGKRSVTVVDDQISKFLQAAVAATTDAEWARAITELTATLAVTATQAPGATLVGTFSRTSGPNPRMMGNTLSALESSPWISLLPLSGAISLPAVSGSLADSKPDEAEARRLPLVAELLSAEQALDQFSSVANTPALLTGPERLELLSLASAAWSHDVVAWEAAVAIHLAKNKQLRNAVHLPESSGVNFFTERGNLPIAVRNELDIPVTVFITVRPERAILNVPTSRVKLTIEASSQAKAFVPVESIANGEVRTTVSLSSATGVPISRPTTVMLNVQAGWETTATVVLAVIVIALFGAGIWRTVWRRRSLRTASDIDALESA